MWDIAIVGMGCRFPGARDLQEYWRLLLAAEPQFRSVPRERWDHGPYFDPADRRHAGTSYSDQVAFVDDIDQFDAAFYRMPPRRVRAMDPQHRLLLDVTREAVQDAGWERGFDERPTTGVFFAMSNSEYAELRPEVGDLQAWSVPGNLLNMAATTVSQYYDLGGPSFTVDAACSSGLVALHQAVTHLRNGSCSRAIVGGAYLNVIPHSLVGFSQVGALSPTGVCRPFDSRADGFVLGEGVGVVVLRPVEDAVRDGDHVYAVIRGMGCSNDGTTDGPMTPRAEGQVLAMERAYADAGVSPRTVGFLEAHGTATTVGDRVELDSLARVRTGAATRDDDPACYLSSVKALIGHSLTSAGLAGLIKTALVVDKGVVPPQPATDVDPAAGLAGAGLEIPAAPVSWGAPARPRRAALNSFGFGGTNVHVVLDSAPAPRGHPAASPSRPELFLFSAGSVELLMTHLTAFLHELTDDAPLTAVARTLATRRLLPSRLAVVAGDVAELRHRLHDAVAGLGQGRLGALGEGVHAADVPLAPVDRAVAFVYPGQGSQRPGMLRDLADHPCFAAAAADLDAAARRAAGCSPLSAVWADDASSDAGRVRLRGTEVCQPVLGVLGLAATRLLTSVGVVPDVTLGHSVGEFTAAAVAGALPDDAAVQMLATRGAAMRGAEEGAPGGMVLVQADDTALFTLTAGLADIWPACHNAPRQTTLAGTVSAVEELLTRCRAAEVPARRLEVSHAFHSPLLDGVRDAVTADLATVPLSAPRETTVFVSSVSGEVCTDAQELRELWSRHASSPVRFAAATTAAHDVGARVFVQVTGGSSLLSTVRQNLADRPDCHYVAVSADQPDDGRSLLAALGHLAVLGVPVDLRGLDARGRPPVVSLPPSPLRTRSYWLPTAPVPARAETPVPPAPRSLPPSTALPAAALPAPRPPLEDTPVNDLVSLFREQLALLRAFDPATLAATPAARVEPVVDGVGLEPTTTPSTAPTAAPKAAPTRSSVAPAAAPSETPAVLDRAGVRRAVHERISRISGFPTGQLDDDQLVVQELGFDSLMLTELLTSFRSLWPELTGRTVDAPKRPTIGALVSSLADLLTQRTTELTTGVEAPSLIVPVVVPAVAPDPEPVVARVGVVREDGLAGFSGLLEHEDGVRALGRNPYFLVHEGTARDTTRVGGRELICFSSYNYLGLSGHPAVNDAVRAAVTRYGTSVSASRFLSGDRVLHQELEAELAGLLGTEDAVVLVSGHATNVSVIGHLVGPDDLVVHDQLAHDSILQGCALSGATRRPFAHDDAEALDALLGRLRPQHRRALVVVEGVYSMDGDIADLPALVEVKERHGALLMVDEAHSIGVVGKNGGGIGDHYGIERSRVDLWAGTLSKALASCGGYVGGSARLVDYLKWSVPGFVYSVGMTPPNAAAALAAIRVLRDEPERLERLRDNSALFVRLARAAGIDTGPSSGSPVVPCIVGDSALALELSHALFDRGVSANPIMYPAVPEELARLRFFITAEHTGAQIQVGVDVLAEELARLTAPRAR